MKKQMKKLVLGKETVRRLEELELGGVAGSGTWQPSCSGCEGSGLWFCPFMPTL